MTIEEFLSHPKIQSMNPKDYTREVGGFVNKWMQRFIEIGGMCSYTILINEETKEVSKIYYSDPSGTTYYDSIQDLYDHIVNGDNTKGRRKPNPSHWTLD